MFEDVKDTRKRSILRAAFEEFAKNGYNFSTNTVAEKAGVSKGLLFFHFKNKNGIILAIMNETNRSLLHKYYEKTEDLPNDLFERLKYTLRIKYQVWSETPYYVNYIMQLSSNIPKDLSNEISKRIADSLNVYYTNLLKDIDCSHFRKDINIKDSIKIVIYTIEGYSLYNSRAELGKESIPKERLEFYYKEAERYIDMLKKLLTADSNK